MNIFDQSKPFTFDRTIRIVITLVIIYVIIRFVSYISDVLIPFAIAIIIAYLLNPIVNWFHKRLKYRILGVIITLLLTIGLIAGTLSIIIPKAISEVTALSKLINEYISNVDFQKQIEKRLPENINEILEDILQSDKIKEFFESEKTIDQLIVVINKMLPGIWGIISGTASFITFLVAITIVFMYLFFLLLDYQKFNKGWKNLLPERWKNQIIQFITDFEDIMKKYFRNQAFIAMIIGIMFAIAFAILQLPLGIIIGLFIGLLNMVPYLQIIGIIPTAFSITMYCMQTGSDFWTITLIVLGIFVFIQAIQDYVLVPLIMGKVTGFNPAIIILSLTVWGKLLGLLGLIIALPMTYLLLTYYKIYILQQITIRSEDNSDT